MIALTLNIFPWYPRDCAHTRVTKTQIQLCLRPFPQSNITIFIPLL
jgi:hypothetical protein